MKSSGPRIPPLWFFTDQDRVPDPRAIVAALPKGLCGVVLRHDDMRLGRDIARSCRDRRNLLVVAGDWKLAHNLRAGNHLRGGRGVAGRGLVTSSVHNRVELERALRAGADAIFISPLFATASHPGQRSLGPTRGTSLATRFHGPRIALGGVTGTNLHRIPARVFSGLGGIGCFMA